MNKQKTDWIKEWNKLTVKSYNLKTEKYEDEPIIFVNDKSWKKVKDFISNLLQQQREEIIKVIKEHRPVFFKGDLHSLLSQDEVMKVREVLRIEILEELGVDCKEIRDRLKQITNLKEK